MKKFVLIVTRKRGVSLIVLARLLERMISFEYSEPSRLAPLIQMEAAMKIAFMTWKLSLLMNYFIVRPRSTILLSLRLNIAKKSKSFHLAYDLQIYTQL